MIELDERTLLNAIDRRTLETLRERDTISLLADLKPILILPSALVIQVSMTIGNVVKVFCGETLVATCQADDEGVAKEIADTLLLMFCPVDVTPKGD